MGLTRLLCSKATSNILTKVVWNQAHPLLSHSNIIQRRHFLHRGGPPQDSRSALFGTNPWLHISEEIQEALDCGRPVVALESTIITHGMPHPTNLDTALAVEQVVRENGAIPATVAILDGRLCVGLTESQLTSLADASSPNALESSPVRKVSRRDLPMILGSKGSTGGTTVSATMLAAYWSGISVFATGGVGGVHRGGQDTMDVSADITELGRTPVCVVSAGIKSLLDVGRSLEYLETCGVCVTGFGVDEFPAFFTRRSGVPTPARIDTVEQAAQLIKVMIQSQLKSGVLVAVPIPEKFEALGHTVEAAIQQAIKESIERGVAGPLVTPFVLERVNEITKGASLSANVELVKNNAGIAAQIAVAYVEMVSNDDNLTVKPGSPEALMTAPTYDVKGVDTPISGKTIVVIGGSSVDQVCRLNSPEVDTVEELHPISYQGYIGQSCGGVGRNVAEALARLRGTSTAGHTRLLTAVSDDLGAAFMRSASSHIDWSHARVIPRGSGLRTASYTALLNTQGHLMFGVGDMEIHSAIDSGYIEGKLVGEDLLAGVVGSGSEMSHGDTMEDSQSVTEKRGLGVSRCVLVCSDGNISLDSLVTVVRLTRNARVPLWYEPTDRTKATKILEAVDLYNKQMQNTSPLSVGSPPARQPRTHIAKCVHYISPNLAEFRELYRYITGGEECTVDKGTSRSRQSFLNHLYEATRRLQRHSIPNWMVKLGEDGVLLVTPDTSYWFDSAVKEGDAHRVVSVSGAGDSMVGCVMHMRFVCQLDWRLSLLGGLRSAELSLSGVQTVSERLRGGDLHPVYLEKWGKDIEFTKFH